MSLDHDFDEDFDDMDFDHKDFDNNDFDDRHLTNCCLQLFVLAVAMTMFRERVFVKQTLGSFYILLIVCCLLSIHIFANIGSTH